MYASCSTSSTPARSTRSADANRRMRAWCRRTSCSALTVGIRPPRANRSVLVAASVPATRAGAVRTVDRLELLEAPPRADRDAGQRALGEVHLHLRLMAQPLVEAGQQRPAAGEDDAAIHDVRSELRRRLVER